MTTHLTSVDFDPFAAPALLRSTTSTESQRELWTASALGPDASAAFNEAVSVRLVGPLDRAALRRAFDALAGAHEALHTSFSADGTALLVEVPAIDFEVEELTALSEAERRARVEAARRTQVTEPFDLSRAPLYRARLLALAPDEHLLLLAGHHIVCDGWSLAVILDDLGTLYSQALDGATPRTPERPRFSDYADAERQRSGGEEHRRAERYWLDRFQGELPVVDLPGDRARPPLKTYASDRVDVVLDAALVASLKALGARQGASFFVTMLAGFTTLVHRLTGTEDLVVGVPAAGQSFTGEHALVGHCVNMLPLRTALAADAPFAALLGDVRRTVLDAYDHQQLTFGSLLNKLAVPRDPSRLPLMTLAFNVDQAVTGEKLGFHGLRAEVATIPRAFENFDLFVNAAERHGAVTLETQYNTDLFDRATVERWLTGFEALLRSAVERPERALGELTLVTPAEQAALDGWNAAAARDRPRGETAVDAFVRSCASAPERTALQAADGAFTYAELDRRSLALAAELRARGVGRGDLVGISLERGSHLLVAVLGVLRAGAAYVPLDPSFPRDRLAFMADDAKLALLVSERKLEPELPAPNVARLFVDDALPPSALGCGLSALGDGGAGAESREPRAESRPDDPAYVIYTSGSTGTPKGVVVPHGAVANFLRAMAEEPGLRADDRLLAVTTLSFDISVLELLLPLSVGATVVLATSAQATDGAALRALIREHQVNVLQATPATWRLLLAAGERFPAGFRALCGGEALPKALADELLATGVELWNMYGPTETTVWSACQQIVPGEARIRVGRPIANTQLHVVDARLQRVPIGVTGELCIAGDGVTLGYLGRPELTAEKFVANPFGGGRLYRTGDLARLLADGTVEVLGRSDGQVKLRGYRIELGEIETVLGRHAGVRQAVVLVREDRPGDQRLVAYVVPAERMPDADALRAHLRQAVPDYMVPQHVVAMSAFPLTPNGKVDRKRLPAPVASAAVSAAHAEPETESERLLQTIWQRILGLPRVGATDDFFQLGGHSLLAAQVIAGIARETQVELSMRRIFEAPTVRGLARLLDEARSGGARADAIPRLEPGARAPLSLMQQRLWFMEETTPGTAIYNVPSSFRLHGRLNREALQRALDTIAERHTTLRTVLGWHDGELRQTVLPTLTFDLTPIDLRHLGRAEREAELRSLLESAAAEPFDVTAGPLARALLFLLGEEESVLFWMPHHAIWDGWSFDLFLDELDRLYAAFSRGEPSPLPPLPITYGDYAAWHRGWIAGPELERQSAFWREQLSGELPVLELPTDRPRPAHLTYAGASEPFALDAELVARLSEIGRRNGATLYMVLLAAFDVFLHRVTGQADLVVGTPIRGRSRPELEPLLGFFVNTLALRTRVEATESFAQLLGRVRESAVQAFGHQDMPFEVLVQELNVPRDPSRTPLVSAFFTFQDVRNRKSSIGDLSYDQIHVLPPVSPTDLSLWVKQLDATVVGGLDYATDLFDRATVQRWLAEYQELLRSIARDAECAVARLQLLPAAELQALRAVSDAARPYPSELWLHQLFEAQADREPNAIAAVFDGRQLTRAELDGRANRLARALRDAGVGSGSRVGICVDRSLEMLVAALAVMKSGAAYVPLDPSFPADRLHFMAEDADLAAIVVHERTRADAPATARARVIDLDAERGRIAALDGARLPAPAGTSAESPAYLIYTSGSTGTPKGVVVPHRSVVNFVTSMLREPGLRPEDRMLAVSALSFDASVIDLYWPLAAGARVVIASREAVSDGDLLDEAVEEHGITAMWGTPATWRLLLAAGFRGAPDFKVLCGGEAFPRELAERLLERAGEVWNLYGPTEIAVCCALKRLERPLGEILIGHAVANSSLHVVDANGELAPWGTPGELWVGGDGVALGYHGRPELTAERFVDNPFRPGRAYRTGDVVRLRAGGELQYVGRNDNQVKLRGYRMELGEIEASLAKLPGVEAAAVLVREDRPGDPRLVAYLVASAGADVSDATLRGQLRAGLPEHMVPQHFVALERFPLTPSGKVDRRALPSPHGTAGATSASYVAPVTDDEKLLAELWQEVLGVPRVSARDNFFDIGGHSLLCLQMTARLEQRTGRRLNPRVILRNDLTQIAALLGDAEATPPASPAAKQESLAQRLLGRLRTR